MIIFLNETEALEAVEYADEISLSDEEVIAEVTKHTQEVREADYIFYCPTSDTVHTLCFD